MSKRNSVGGSGNTLFNYFVKSPTPNKVAKPTSAGTPENASSPKTLKQHSNGNVKRKIKEATRADHSTTTDCESEKEKKNLSNDEDDIPVAPKRKRIRLVSEDSSEEDKSDLENKDQSTIKQTLEKSFKFTAKSSPVSSPISKAKKPNKSETSISSSLGGSDDKPGVLDDSNNWLHCRLDWLRPENIKDGNKRKQDDPNYDPKTLYVPEEFRKTQTPAHKQWWDMKAAHFDCVLFFKVGKFYELYHMDAAVGVNELGFSYMKGEFAHSGFPESAYARMASSLVQKGYRVARVEQTETPDMLAERMKKMSVPNKEKVVRREVCQITCKGIEVCGLLDNGPSDATASYMIAIVEQDIGVGRSKYGVCFVDTSIGLFHLGQFDDDKHSSRLLTTLAHHPPALLLQEKGAITDRSNRILKMSCHSVRKEYLTPQKQFWSASQTLTVLAETYFQENSKTSWPRGLRPFLSESDSLGLTPAENCELAIRALGACVWYLTDSLLDVQILGMANFKEYNPPDTGVEKSKETKDISIPSNMVLDAITLHNLHIVGDTSLISKLDHCCTAMGKRLLHQWVCSPSCNIEVIKERQKAIQLLLDEQSLVQDAREILKTLPDLERTMAKIHTLGNLNRSKNHPDGRAILYEMKTYSKRKVMDFITLINGFEVSASLVARFENCDSSLLKRITQTSPEGRYPEYSEFIQFFKDAFDHNLAQKEGTIIPEKGVDSEYDSVLEKVADIKRELEEYLKSQEKYFNCRVSYVGSDKKRYQLEVPESKCGKAGSRYFMEGARKGFKRFSTEESKDLLAQIIAAEAQMESVLKDLSRRIFEKFGQSHLLWQKGIQSIASLDVLISLSEYARLQSNEICIPDLHTATNKLKPYITIKDGRHPCIVCQDDFIPNDSHLGEPSLVVLTGPNMGGKSTLMRQLGLLTIMAQIGCHIPALECSMTVVDRIFTRLGAHDDIMTGQSTFLVELSETSAILKHATVHSLVLLDELGRGTSTYDGTAIAAAVLDDLCLKKCRTMFSTHYHTLVDDFQNNPEIALAHMACMVESEEADTKNSDSVAQETVTFLYKLSPGACPKSYGFNAARLAGISKNITSRAFQIAMQMEKEANLVALFKTLCSTGKKPEKDNLKELIMACKKAVL